jgi:hypothetical protein
MSYTVSPFQLPEPSALKSASMPQRFVTGNGTIEPSLFKSTAQADDAYEMAFSGVFAIADHEHTEPFKFTSA